MIVGSRLHDVVELAERVAQARVPVILHGETGTGKEVFARFLHDRGPRSARRMVRVNCGAIPGELVESTFFGHERGAFTGAVQPQKGAFEEADGSTIFLDEIGELAPRAQACLLRALEVGAFCRVGSAREIEVDVRIIVATHRDLEAMVRDGRFREDLYYRLSTISLAIPPLRERLDEIEPLARQFLRTAGHANGRAVEDLEPEVLARLRAHHWPGNVRELRNVIEHAVVLSRGTTVRVRDLPPHFASDTRREKPEPGDLRPSLPSPGDRLFLLHDFEARVIVEALETCDWRVVEAAQRLNMPRRTLSRRIRMLGIQRPSR